VNDTILRYYNARYLIVCPGLLELWGSFGGNEIKCESVGERKT
jgi:hypothetical protein